MPNLHLKSFLLVFLIVVGYGCALLGIWFFGPADIALRVVLAALVFLTLPAGVLIKYYFDQRRAQSPAEDAPGSRRARRRDISPELSQTAQEIVNWLRATRLEDQGNAVYALPWFLMAGMPGSGKTSLLYASKLDFYDVAGRGTTNRIRPTQNCEWQTTDQAIFLDTTGRYQSEQGRDDWESLMAVIQKFRSQRPLDGIVVVAHLPHLLTANDAEVDRQAKLIRARVDEALTQLEIHPPIYLVLTGADAIEGFQTFFGDLPGSEKAQVWGTTFPLSQSAQAYSLLDTELSALQDILRQQFLRRLGEVTGTEQKLKVFQFPDRFQDARRKCVLLASVLFRPSTITGNLQFRGAYLTSSLGGGFFIEQVMKQILRHDVPAVPPGPTVVAEPPRARLIVNTVCAICLVFTLGMIVSFWKNSRLIGEVNQHVVKIHEARKVGNGLQEKMARDDFKKRLDQLDSQTFPWSLFWVEAGDDLNEKARRNYVGAPLPRSGNEKAERNRP